MSFDWKKTLATVAPMIGTALGGPMGGLAANIATKALGIENADNPEQALAEAVSSGNPDVLLQLREADNTFKLEMERLGVDLERVHAADRSGARGLAKTKGMLPQVALSTLYVLGFLYVLQQVLSGQVADEMREPFMFLLGILSAGLTQIMNFWFGSSSGSKEKTAGLIK